MNEIKYKFALLNPRYWLTWLLLGLMRAITLLPYAAQMRCGEWIGLLVYRFAKKRRNIARINIKSCFPEKNPQEQLRLLREHFISLGKGIIETALSWWGKEKKLRPLMTITGLEHLELAISKGKGVILLSAHFTTLEIGGRLLAMHHPFHVLYRKHNNPAFELVMHNARQRRFKKAIPRKNTHSLIKTLREGNALWYAPDQNYSGPNSVFVPFFNIPASTTTATSRLSSITGATVIPFTQIRLPHNEGYLLTLCPPLNNYPTEHSHTDTARINTLIEQIISEYPEQYLWVHRRFKSQPPDHKYLY